MLRTENLTAGYGAGTILEDITFQIEKGERFVVLGESGCGKSTFTLIVSFPIIMSE